MGNSLFRCCCCCCMNNTEQHRPLFQQKSVYYGKSEEKSCGYHQLPTETEIVGEKQNNIIEFNDYDNIIKINSDLLLIFGYIRNAQNCLSLDIAHHIIPQSVINIICNYSQKPTLSVFKITKNYYNDVKRVACNVKKLFINGSSLFFLSPNDHIYVFGSNQNGKLGIKWSTDGLFNTIDQPQTTTFYQKHRFKLVSSSSCGTLHERSIAVTLNDDVYGYGHNGYFKTFGAQDPSIKNSYTVKITTEKRMEVFWPTLIDIKYKIIDIRLGDSHSLFLTDNGKVLGCGGYLEGQLGMDYFAWINAKSQGVVRLIDSLLNDTIIQIRCGCNFSLVLTDSGILKGFGSYSGTFEAFGGKSRPKKIKITDDDEYNPRILTMECGTEHACCLDENGNVYCWGEKYIKPIQIEIESVTHISCSFDGNFAMDDEMNIYHWDGVRFSDVEIIYNYNQFQHLIDGKRIIDINAAEYGDIYLCVANH